MNRRVHRLRLLGYVNCMRLITVYGKSNQQPRRPLGGLHQVRITVADTHGQVSRRRRLSSQQQNTPLSSSLYRRSTSEPLTFSHCVAVMSVSIHNGVKPYSTVWSRQLTVLVRRGQGGGRRFYFPVEYLEVTYFLRNADCQFFSSKSRL